VQPGVASIEVVRGALGEARAQEILALWSEHGALEGEEARQRLPEVVCIALGGSGEVIGVNSAHAEEIPLVGRRLWRYRSFLPGVAEELSAEMFNAAFAALGEGFDPDAPGPIGLAVNVTESADIEGRPEAVWPEEELVYAGYLPDDSQLRVRYFWNAKIGPGPDDSPPLEDTVDETYPIGDDYRVVPFADSSITPEDVLALWGRETGIPPDDARRRVHQVQLVAINKQGGLAGISTAFVQRNAQLRMDFWHYRTYVAIAERHNNLMGRLALAVRDHLEQRFTSGEDTQAAGILMEVENEGLKSYFNRALWLPLGMNFVGENHRGDHVRVRYFPGAKVPAPG
jgi:hypothetical protein